MNLPLDRAQAPDGYQHHVPTANSLLIWPEEAGCAHWAMQHHISKRRTHANAQAQFKKRALLTCKILWKNHKDQTALPRISLCKRTSLSFPSQNFQDQQVKENMGNDHDDDDDDEDEDEDEDEEDDDEDED